MTEGHWIDFDYPPLQEGEYELEEVGVCWMDSEGGEWYSPSDYSLAKELGDLDYDCPKDGLEDSPESESEASGGLDDW